MATQTQTLPGRSRCDIARQTDDLNRTIFSEYHDGGSITGTFMARWDQWKYVHYVGVVPQLLKLHDNPQEFTDLATETNNSRGTNALAEGRRRLYDISDPEEVNKQCFSDQNNRIEELGGKDACLNAYVFNHTPTPNEQTKRGRKD